MNTPRDARRLVRTRALRYDTWQELQRAVHTWCRERIAKENPSFDVTALEGQLRGWVSDWASDNDEAYARLAGLVNAVVAADEYLEAHPSAPNKNIFAAMIAGALGARCEGTEEGHSRMHGTTGVDSRLFEWKVFGLVKPFDYWQLSLAADGARKYLNTSFRIGFWH